MKKYYVYKLCNTKNQKVYIGQTNSPSSRFYAQQYRGTKIKQAIEEIGWENFFVINLYSTNDQEKANQKELSFIKKYDSVNNGYNSNYKTHEHRYTTRSKHRNALASSTMSMLKWYWNPTTGEAVRLMTNNIPEGFIPGRGSSKTKTRGHSLWMKRKIA